MKHWDETQARAIRSALNSEATRIGIAAIETDDLLRDIDQLTAATVRGSAHSQVVAQSTGQAAARSESAAGGDASTLLQRYAALKTDNERATFVSQHAAELDRVINAGEAGIGGLDALPSGTQDAGALVSAYGKLTTDAERSAFLAKHGEALDAAIIRG